ncbi:MAG: helix-turn-helix domain-containing protein [Lachnospiraceae bacterium]|nr:helix-turn-helix domain-containing protein [Lachnospiraceae bacterium]
MQEEAIETEADIAKVISKARVSSNMTQKELADKSGINQSDISKLESGARNPSIAILKRLADGMGMNLNISFTPKGKS